MVVTNEIFIIILYILHGNSMLIMRLPNVLRFKVLDKINEKDESTTLFPLVVFWIENSKEKEEIIEENVQESKEIAQ